MRRSDREVKDPNELDEMLKKGEIIHLAMVDDGIPYVVPLHYGYDNGVIYFHCAKAGRKIDILSKNNYVCFEVDYGMELLKGEMACDYSAKFQSVIGYGHAFEIEEDEEKIYALNILMGQYVKQNLPFQYRPNELNSVCVYKIAIEKMTGKRKG